MENEEQTTVTYVGEMWLDALGYLAEMQLENGKSYKKEYRKEGNEWRELSGTGWQRDYNYLSSAQMASIGATATEFWDGDHASSAHKYVTGDRLDMLKAEAVQLEERAISAFQLATTADGLIEARLKRERAQGMLDMLRFVRGHYEGDK
jgi:hypothetical protein